MCWWVWADGEHAIDFWECRSVGGKISRAKVIVELSKEDFVVEASQGTHFFHNLISANVCYLTLQENSGVDFLDWEKDKELERGGRR